MADSPYGAPDVDWRILTLTPLHVESAAQDAGFSLERLVTVLRDGSFLGEIGPCELALGSDTFCSGSTSASPWTWTAGTWDGRTLVWNGSQEAAAGIFNYSITAVAASVPEPGTLPLTVPLLAFLAARRLARPT